MFRRICVWPQILFVLPFLSTHLFFLQEKPGQHVLIDGKEAIFLQRSARSPQVGPKVVQKIKVCYGILTQPFLNLINYQFH